MLRCTRITLFTSVPSLLSLNTEDLYDMKKRDVDS